LVLFPRLAWFALFCNGQLQDSVLHIFQVYVTNLNLKTYLPSLHHQFSPITGGGESNHTVASERSEQRHLQVFGEV
jgi:hypothetical protein